MRLTVPSESFAAAFAAPLGMPYAPLGIFALVSRDPGVFTGGHEAFVEELVRPLTVALANDMRLHEFNRMRESLEADKRALLQKLDPDNISDAIIGNGSGLRRVMERVEKVSATDAPVPLLGETGSGKEVVARAIHERSRRSGAPIVRVNCGAMPAGLIDSELFGHERGNFSGAVASRKGWFERADGGTLVLDEVAELPLDAQVRLLRTLHDGTFERVGGQKTQSLDVRIVAATHRNLEERLGAERSAKISGTESESSRFLRCAIVRKTFPRLGSTLRLALEFVSPAAHSRSIPRISNSSSTTRGPVAFASVVRSLSARPYLGTGDGFACPPR